MDTFSEAIDHALVSVFVVKQPIYEDEKARREPENTPDLYLKVGTQLTVHAVIITLGDVNVSVMFSAGSLSGNLLCASCLKEKQCMGMDWEACPATSMEFPIELLATHCELWEPFSGSVTAHDTH